MRFFTTLLVTLPFAFALPQSTVDVGTIQALSSKINEAQNTFNALHNELESLLSTAKPNLGSIASNVEQAQTDWNAGFLVMIGSLARIGAELSNSASTFQETDQTMNQVWSRARK